MSKSLNNRVRKLRIRKGDIVLAHPSLRDQFMQLRVPEIDWTVPILWTVNPKDIRTVNKQKLVEMLKKEGVI